MFCKFLNHGARHYLENAVKLFSSKWKKGAGESSLAQGRVHATMAAAPMKIQNADRA